VPVCYSERVAVDAVSGPELPFEIDGPYGVGFGHGSIRSSRVISLPGPPSRLDESVAFKDGRARTDGGPWFVGVLSAEPWDDLLGSPGRVAFLLLENGVDTVVWCSVRARVRSSGAIVEILEPAFEEPAEPLVSGLPADAVSVTEFGHVIDSKLVVVDETDAFRHG